MVLLLSSLNASLTSPSPTTSISSNRFRTPSHRQGASLPIVSCRRNPELSKSTNFGSSLEQNVLQKSGFLVAASLAVVFWSSPGDSSLFLGLFKHFYYMGFSLNTVNGNILILVV